MTEMFVKIYKRRRDGTYTANLVKHSYKKGKAISVKKVNV
jgi:hypothetical protein